MNNKVHDTESFIRKSRMIHGDRYDYSLVNYINTKTKIKIICPIHGVFEQRPGSHIKGQGCKKCAIEKSKKDAILRVKEKFNRKVREVHGDKYDYSLVDYISTNTKIKIICPIHGVFEQRMTAHLGGQGCKECAYEKIFNEKRLKHTELFIEKSKEVHNGKYDYSLVEYIDNKTRVKIICPVHGVFEQNPTPHLNGSGCSKCFYERRISESQSKNSILFIEKARRVHGDRFDYSLVDYITSKIKVKIICPDHGVFEQQPCAHINGQGCRKCRLSRGEQKILDYLEWEGLNYEFEYSPPALGRKRFDFYLTDHEIAIEYDGIQHFYPVIYNYKMTEEEAERHLRESQQRDKEKEDWCQENGVELVRIKYTQFEEIEEILDRVCGIERD